MPEENLVNIGSAERPVFVPRKALEPETADGREWWGMVAEGSVILEEETLRLLAERLDAQKDQKP